MKYAFMSFSCPKLELGEMLALAKRLGYEGVEPRIGSGHAHGVEVSSTASRRKELRERAAASGVALCCVATSCKYADPATAKEQVGETLRCIDLAADVGSPRLRVFGGALGKGLSREAAVELVAGSLGAVAKHAEDRGVTVCMETHDEWTNPSQVAEVMKRVDRPSIGVNWDIMHPVRQSGSTMDAAFGALGPWIRHVHFHDGVRQGEKLELAPVGTGFIDHRRAVELLKSASYDGYLSGEWINWEAYEVHLPRELATMKRYERGAG